LRTRLYPPARFPDTELHTILTGFVPDDHEAIENAVSPKPVADRPIGVGYRGRRLSPAYGRLGRLKAEVEGVMLAEAQRRHVVHDISIEEKDRIYGDEGLRFIASCRCMLGSESGSNIFDWDGSIHRRCREETDPSSLRAIASEIEASENDAGMGQISPRIFECAMLRKPMALIAGRYSGLIEADTHYIPIAEDFTNLDEVFRRIADTEAIQAMADRAHADLVATEAHTSQRNIERIVQAIQARSERYTSIRPVFDHPDAVDFFPPSPGSALIEEPTPLPRLLKRPWRERRFLSTLFAMARLVVPQRHHAAVQCFLRTFCRKLLKR
jgi:hypothetical protein